MREVGLIIDLDQLPLSDEDSVKEAVTGFYNPLIKLLKSDKEISVTLKISLGTLELLDKFGHGSVISDIKDLYSNDRIEIAGSTSYGADISDLPEEIAESNVVLNEYGLGYYLGSRQGFEGEPSIMLKDVSGFISNTTKLDRPSFEILSQLGYEWVALEGDFESYKPISEIRERDIFLVEFLRDLNSFETPSEMVWDFEDEGAEYKSFISEKIKNLNNRDIDSLFLLLGTDKKLYFSEKISYSKILNKVILTMEKLKEESIKIVSVSQGIKSVHKKEQKDIEILVNANYKKKPKIKDMNIDVKNLIEIFTQARAYMRENDKIDTFSPINAWCSDNSLKDNTNKIQLYTSIIIYIHKLLSTLSLLDNNKDKDSKIKSYYTEVTLPELVQKVSDFSKLIQGAKVS